MRYQLQMFWSVSWLSLWGAEALDIRQIRTSKKKKSVNTNLHTKSANMCSRSLSLTKEILSSRYQSHIHKKTNVRYVVFYCPHTQTNSFSEIIPDQQVSRAETLRNYSEATPPLRQHITVSQKQVQKWLQNHTPRTLGGRVF